MYRFQFSLSAYKVTAEMVEEGSLAN